MHNARLRAVIGLLAVSLLTCFSVPARKTTSIEEIRNELRQVIEWKRKRNLLVSFGRTNPTFHPAQ